MGSELNSKPVNVSIQSPWLDKHGIAIYLGGISIRKVYDLRREKKIPYNKALRRYHIHECDKALGRFTQKAIGDYQSHSE
jgi:hypothetical protein